MRQIMCAMGIAAAVMDNRRTALICFVAAMLFQLWRYLSNWAIGTDILERQRGKK